MIKHLLLISLFIVNFTLAQDIADYKNVMNESKLTITQDDIRLIKLSPNKKSIIKRLKSYKELILRAKNQTTEKKLVMVNSFFNKFQYKQDSKLYASSDYWATKKEFLMRGFGDCEDYAIAKYAALVELGVPLEKLALYLTYQITQKLR